MITTFPSCTSCCGGSSGSSGSSGASNCCNGLELPDTLYAEITDATGCFVSFIGQTHTLSYIPSVDYYADEYDGDSVGCDTWSFLFSCDSPYMTLGDDLCSGYLAQWNTNAESETEVCNWNMWSCVPGAGGPPIDIQCSPFQATMTFEFTADIAGTCFCCSFTDASVTVVVTEGMPMFESQPIRIIPPGASGPNKPPGAIGPVNPKRNCNCGKKGLRKTK